LLEKAGPLEDVWAQISPETEVERLSCLNVQKDENIDPLMTVITLTDFNVIGETTTLKFVNLLHCMMKLKLH